MNVLAFFAHPDDETMLAGGTLAYLARQGVFVHYLCATRGEGGEVGVPPVCALEQLGETREAELVCAVRALGGASLTFLGYVDPRVGPDETLYGFTEDLDELIGKIVSGIRRANAGAVITHGSNGEYGHPAHRLAYQAAKAAVETLGADAPVLYTVQAFFPDHPRPRLANPDDPADLVLDVNPVLDKKITAALCHRTQHDLFTRKTAEEVGHVVTVLDAVKRMRIESLHRVLPPPTHPLDDALADALVPIGR